MVLGSGQEQWQNSNEERRIYLVTDGLKSKHTAKVYSSTFKGFIKYLQNIDLKALLDFRPDVIESKIISYLEYLQYTRKLSFWTIQVHYSAIHHWFDINDVVLNSRKIKKFLPSDESYRDDRPYSVEEIFKILDKCDIRQRVIILLFASTGMRVGALPGLRIGDIKKFEEYNLYLIWVYNNSRKDRYYTFCTPECAQAIDDYLAYRKRLGEEINETSPLIRNKISVDNPFTTKTAKPIEVRSIQNIVEKLQKQAGIGLKKKEIATCHGFRKAYISTLDKAGVRYTTREYLSGHRLPGQDNSYLRLSEEDRLLEYRKAIDLLTISSESKLRHQIKNKEKDIKFIYEEISSLKRCVKHMTAAMQKLGYNTQQTQEFENRYDECADTFIEYADKVTELGGSDFTQPSIKPARCYILDSESEYNKSFNPDVID